MPEAKSGKNRLHLDIQPPVGTRDAEVERLAGIGAVVADDRRRAHRHGLTHRPRRATCRA
ncbi:VOC family protein [Streptomyces monticola]|uniref:VOC family protein n=1 Tax=Streptomyces monticola TaxID=2666263 RepID=A0ABW2JPY1_9ACTN